MERRVAPAPDPVPDVEEELWELVRRVGTADPRPASLRADGAAGNDGVHRETPRVREDVAER